jgi:hypothetical protein
VIDVGIEFLVAKWQAIEYGQRDVTGRFAGRVCLRMYSIIVSASFRLAETGKSLI